MYSFRDQLQPVLTGFLQFFAVPVRGFCILKLSGTGPVRSPSKKDNRTETGPDFKALIFGITSQDCLAKINEDDSVWWDKNVVWAHIVMNDAVWWEWIYSSHQRMTQWWEIVTRGIHRRERRCINVLYDNSINKCFCNVANVYVWWRRYLDCSVTMWDRYTL